MSQAQEATAPQGAKTPISAVEPSAPPSAPQGEAGKPRASLLKKVLGALGIGK